MMSLWSALCGTASATSGFDPSTPEERFEGQETWSQNDDGTEDVRLWNAIERWSDPDRLLLRQESFNEGVAWKDTMASPYIATAFGTPTPPSSTFLLHVGLHEQTAEGTPILMVPGAGDNASRGFVTLATKLDRLNRPVYALTFAHPHGDVFQQAEILADAISVVRQRTGSEQIDLVGHSKGGLAIAVYLANTEDSPFAAPYGDIGTPYRGDVRRAVFVASPLGGVDTSYRWTGLNLYSLDPDTAISPSAWSRYYPNTTAVPLVSDDLKDQDFLPDGQDYFPGQRQILRRQDHPLPGTQAWMGIYALQPDWYTTYEGGLGLLSFSEGIDEAIEAGGSLVDQIASAGLTPDVQYFQLAGSNPLMPNGDDALIEQFSQIGDNIDWQDLFAEATERGTPIAADDDELSGLVSGWLVLGELSGPSDGLVFVDSALDDRAITARGGSVTESYTANLSHLDLLYASPITGDLLLQAADAGGPEEQWMRGVGLRYTEADTLGFIVRVLEDEPGTGTETGDTGAPPGGDGAAGGAQAPGDYQRPCGSCATGPSAVPWLLLPALLARRCSRRSQPSR